MKQMFTFYKLLVFIFNLKPTNNQTNNWKTNIIQYVIKKIAIFKNL
jgi:hypothetical protein